MKYYYKICIQLGLEFFGGTTNQPFTVLNYQDNKYVITDGHRGILDFETWRQLIGKYRNSKFRTAHQILYNM